MPHVHFLDSYVLVIVFVLVMNQPLINIVWIMALAPRWRGDESNSPPNLPLLIFKPKVNWKVVPFNRLSRPPSWPRANLKWGPFFPQWYPFVFWPSDVVGPITPPTH